MDLSWTLHQFLIEKSKHVLLPDKNLNPLKLSMIRWISLLSLAGNICTCKYTKIQELFESS